MKKLHLLFALISALAIAASSFLGVAQAAGTDATVTVSRMDRTHIEITIAFTSGIEGDFGGVIGGSHFSCAAANSTTLVCIAQIQPSGQPMLLSIYNKATSEVILTSVISAPKMEPREKDPTPAPPGCSPQFKTDPCKPQ